MKNISFALTTPQILARTKTVTRRRGWRDLLPGELLCAVEKGQGLKKGEKVRRLGVIRIVSVRRELLDEMLISPEYGELECAREGFPEMEPAAFVAFFCRTHGNVKPYTYVTRIEFEYVEDAR